MNEMRSAGLGDSHVLSQEDSIRPLVRPVLITAAYGVPAVAAMALLSRWNFLLFHASVELFSVIVVLSVFVVAWNARRVLDNGFFAVIAAGFVGVGVLDLTHTLAYKGMGVFPAHGADLATQLWIAGRYLQAGAFFVGSLLMGRRLSLRGSLIVAGAITALLLLSIFTFHVFPACYVEGQGLTPFKRISEFVVIGLLLVSIVVIQKRRSRLDPTVRGLIIAGLVVSIASEAVFCLYINVHGLTNTAGHLLKVLAVLFVYRAVLETGIKRPHQLLLRELKLSEENLRLQRDEVQRALDQVQTLRGLLPICAQCKKVRDDKGYWSRIEHYISEHSEAQFTHGLCPGCAEDLMKQADRFLKSKQARSSRL